VFDLECGQEKLTQQLCTIYIKEIEMQETMEQSIGLSAGQIYNYLAENEGQSTFAKMKKE
jgi:hypothetical protein